MNRQISIEEALLILKSTQYGVLSLVNSEGDAYGIPINHVYLPEENCIFFHCAKKGEKLECIKCHSQVSFAAVGNAKVIPDKYTTYYESVIVSGKASIVTDEDEKLRKLLVICEHFSPDENNYDEIIQKHWKAVEIYKIEIEKVTGKRNV